MKSQKNKAFPVMVVALALVFTAYAITSMQPAEVIAQPQLHANSQVSSSRIGDVVYSVLDELDFQKLSPSEEKWVALQGQRIEDDWTLRNWYHPANGKLPNGSGMFLRVQNPQQPKVVGSFEPEMIGSHAHHVAHAATSHIPHNRGGNIKRGSFASIFSIAYNFERGSLGYVLETNPDNGESNYGLTSTTTFHKGDSQLQWANSQNKDNADIHVVNEETDDKQFTQPYLQGYENRPANITMNCYIRVK